MNTTRDDSMSEFSARLTLALNEAGYQANQQAKLGELFGISGQAVRKWIQAESMPSSNRAKSIADALDVRVSWLMYGEAPMRDGINTQVSGEKVSEKNAAYNMEISQKEQAIIEDLRTLPKPTRDALVELIRSLKP